ncbi:hypothetical protein CJU89_0659 [Yarrowia sp. B02]|nr:hypothetical protein CJU89_0659 [Yarrowia sp. B02]
MSTRACYRRCVRAANTIATSGYNSSGKFLAATLKDAFAKGSATPEQQLRTTEFLERAARYRGVESDVIRNMITIDVVRRANLVGLNPYKRQGMGNEEFEGALHFALSHNLPGAKEYSEALREGKLPDIRENTRLFSDVIKLENHYLYSEYDNLIKGLNQTMNMALPLGGQVLAYSKTNRGATGTGRHR